MPCPSAEDVIEAWDPMALRWLYARYQDAAQMACEDVPADIAVGYLLRAGMALQDAEAVVQRTYAEHRRRRTS